MPFVKSVPENARPSSILRQFPESGALIMDFTEQLLRGKSSLTPAQRELIAAYTSGLNTCRFCRDTHSATAEALGVEKGLVNSLVEDIESSAVDPEMKPILRYVRKLTESPSRMTQADVDAIFAAGWDEDAFYHAVSICGLFNYYNRLIEGYGVKSAPDYRDLIGQRLAQEGYSTALKHDD
jgi:uncharacterized peroxidase-related enzyme